MRATAAMQTGSLRALRTMRDGERPFGAPHAARAGGWPLGHGGSFSRPERLSPPSAPGAPASRGIHREGGSRVEGSLPCAGACFTATGLKRAPCCGAGCPLRRGPDGLFGRALLRPRVRRAAGVARRRAPQTCPAAGTPGAREGRRNAKSNVSRRIKGIRGRKGWRGNVPRPVCPEESCFRALDKRAVNGNEYRIQEWRMARSGMRAHHTKTKGDSYVPDQ